jgi:hypothetical protein
VIRRLIRGYKVARLCDRWRAAMTELGEPVGRTTNKELLDSLARMVATENPGAGPEQVATGTLWLLEASTIGAEAEVGRRCGICGERSTDEPWTDRLCGNCAIGR